MQKGLKEERVCFYFSIKREKTLGQKHLCEHTNRLSRFAKQVISVANRPALDESLAVCNRSNRGRRLVGGLAAIRILRISIMCVLIANRNRLVEEFQTATLAVSTLHAAVRPLRLCRSVCACDRISSHISLNVNVR